MGASFEGYSKNLAPDILIVVMVSTSGQDTDRCEAAKSACARDAVVKPTGAEKRHEFGVSIIEIEVDVTRLAASSGSPSRLGANGGPD